MSSVRATAMKMWARSWHTPRPSTKASSAVVDAWVGAVSKVTRSCRAPITACRVDSVSLPACSRAKAVSSSPGSVRLVERKKTSGANRSIAPRTTPWVSQVSTSPSTVRVRRETGPATKARWVMLPSGSSPFFRAASESMSSRQRITCWPSCRRGVRRSSWTSERAGVS